MLSRGLIDNKSAKFSEFDLPESGFSSNLQIPIIAFVET